MSEEKRERVELSTFDCSYAMIGLNFAYFFDSLLDVNDLQASLDKTVKFLPQLSSVLVKDTKKIPNVMTTKYHLELCENPIKIVTKSVDDKLSEAYLPKGRFNLISIKEGSPLHEEMEKIEIIDFFKGERFPIEESELFKVTMLNCDGIGKSILCISISHAIVDAGSLQIVMDIWQGFHNLEDYEPPALDLDRVGNFTRSPKFFQVQRGKEDLIRLGVHYPATMEVMLAMTRVYVFRSLVFTKERVEEMKKLAKSQCESLVKISTNDVICAHMWRLFASLRDEISSRIFPLCIVKGFRNIAVKQSFFGNACSTLNVELTRKEILSKSFGELVTMVRKLVDSLTTKDVQFLVDLLERNPYPIPKRSFDYLYGCNVDDWRMLTRELPGFGKSKCVRFFPPIEWKTKISPVLPNFFIMTACAKGMELWTPIEINVHKKVRNLDLTDPESVKKISTVLVGGSKVEIDDAVKENCFLINAKKLRFLVVGIDRIDKKLVVEKVGTLDTGLDDLKKELPLDDGRYVLYNYEYQVEEGKRQKLVYIKWIPDSSDVKTRMLYAMNGSTIKETRAVDWNFGIQIHEIGDVNEEVIGEKCKKFF